MQLAILVMALEASSVPKELASTAKVTCTLSIVLGTGCRCSTGKEIFFITLELTEPNRVHLVCPLAYLSIEMMSSM